MMEGWGAAVATAVAASLGAAAPPPEVASHMNDHLQWLGVFFKGHTAPLRWHISSSQPHDLRLKQSCKLSSAMECRHRQPFPQELTAAPPKVGHNLELGVSLGTCGQLAMILLIQKILPQSHYQFDE